jgi:hypothetical protein
LRALQADDVQFLEALRERQLADENARRKANANEFSHFKAFVLSFSPSPLCGTYGDISAVAAAKAPPTPPAAVAAELAPKPAGTP